MKAYHLAIIAALGGAAVTGAMGLGYKWFNRSADAGYEKELPFSSANASIADVTASAPDPADRNPLEKLLDVGTATAQQFEELAAAGGLDVISDWHGIDISSFQPAWEQGKLAYFLAYTSATTPIAQVKAAINRACGFNADDWRKVGPVGFVAGEAANAKCEGRYSANGRVWAIDISTPGWGKEEGDDATQGAAANESKQSADDLYAARNTSTSATGEEAVKQQLVNVKAEYARSTQALNAVWSSLHANSREEILAAQRDWVRRKMADCREIGERRSTDPDQQDIARLQCEISRDGVRKRYLERIAANETV